MFEGLNGAEVCRLVLLSIAWFFMAGALFGWIFELFFRRFLTAKRWVNPGFLKGPYLPLYGFAAVAMYGFGMLRFANPIPDTVPGAAYYWDAVIVLLIIAATVVLELLAGLIFLKWLKIPLWNYDKSKDRFLGVLSLKFVLLWAVLGAIFYFFLFTPMLEAALWCQSKDYMIFVFGLFYGFFLADLCYSVYCKVIKPKINKSFRQNAGQTEDIHE